MTYFIRAEGGLRSMSRHTTPRPPRMHKVSRFGIRLLVALAILNVNNIIFMISGQRQVVSAGMLALSGALLAKLWSKAPKLRGLLLFLVALGSYLVLGSLAAVAQGVPISSAAWLRYCGTAMVVAAVALYTVAAEPRERRRLLEFIHLMLIIASVSIWMTPVLLPLWKYMPLAFETRLSGVFANPNEGGFVAALALAFTLFLPSHRRWVRGLFLVAAIGGVILSFSKAAAAAALLVVALFVLKCSGRGVGPAFAVIIASGALLVANLPSAVGWTSQQTAIPMNGEQRERVEEFAEILAGRFDEHSTTGRLGLWQVGLEQISKRFVTGTGLDTFQHLEGGVMNPITGEWQGVHNVFLLIIGDSGIIAICLFMWFLIFVVLNIRSGFLPYLCLGLVLVTLVDMNSNHSTLTLRYSNVVLGLLIALASLKPQRDIRK